jgi:signal transduction histidine kinase
MLGTRDNQLTPKFRRLSISIAFLLLGAIFLALGVRYDLGQSAALHSFMQQRGEGIVASVEQITLSAKAEATILALQHTAGLLPRSSIRLGLPIESALLQVDPTTGRLTVSQVVNGAHGAGLFQPGQAHAFDGKTLEEGTQVGLLPTAAPQFLVFCAASTDAVVACSAVGLQTVMRRASTSAVYQVEIQVKQVDGTVVAEMPGFSTAPTDRGTTQTALPLTPLELVARPSAALIAGFKLYWGTWAASAGVLLLALIATATALNRRGQKVHAALASERARSLPERLEAIRQSLHDVANAGGLRFYWMTAPDEVELFGPWDEAAGIHDDRISAQALAAGTDRPDFILASARAAFEARQPWSQVFNRCVDGVDAIHQSNATPIMVDDQFVGMVGVSADITSAIASQKSRQEIKDEVSAVIEHVRHLGYETRGPILSLSASLRMLKQAAEAGRSHQMARWHETARASLERLEQVLRAAVQLITLRQSDHAQAALTAERPSAFIASTIEALQGSMEERHQTTEVKVHSDASARVHDASLLSILRAILGNAISYSPPGSSVHIDVLAEGARINIVVVDEGPGMSSMDLENLGRPFYRGSAAHSPEYQGGGLGIALSMELARHSAAELSFRNSEVEGRGLIVMISLPRAHEITVEADKII